MLTGISPEDPAAREELCGPVATIFKARDEEEAVAIANDTSYGLGSYVFTTDPGQAQLVARGIDVTMVFINDTGAFGAELPCGGVMRSGFGRELGPRALTSSSTKELIRTQWNGASVHR